MNKQALTKSRIRKGDVVVVIAGRDRGKSGKVLSVDPAVGIPLYWRTSQVFDTVAVSVEKFLICTSMGVETMGMEGVMLVLVLTRA